MGPDKIIGYSAHTIDEALSAQTGGADFVTFGPVHHTPSKLHYGEPCGVKKLAEAASALEIPVFGLGGISSANITGTLSASVQGIAVISAILTAADPRVATASLLKKIEEHAQHH
jgi:thiamine-phosphate pyrophosphorylase